MKLGVRKVVGCMNVRILLELFDSNDSKLGDAVICCKGGYDYCFCDVHSVLQDSMV
jgi:hypothetical protein